MIDCDAIRSARLLGEPFTWASVPGVLDPSAADALLATFPSEGFRESARAAADKSYRHASREIVARGRTAATRLAPPWQDLVAALRSDDYRGALEELSGARLDGAELELTLWRYGPDCWLSPHCDKPAKLLTHLLYFNAEWRPEWGGCLQILRSRDGADVAAEVVPTVSESVVLVRCDASWHAVAPVRREVAGERTRRSLTAVFYADRGAG